MSVPKVRLYIRVALPDGKRPFLDPVHAANQKLKEGWAIYQGQPQRFEEFTYYLRYAKSSKRVYERLGSDAQQALVSKRSKEFRLQAAAKGIELQPAALPSEEKPASSAGRALLECVESYLDEVAAHKSKKTLAAYSETLHLFIEAIDSKRKDIPIWAQKQEKAPALKDYLDHPDWLSNLVRNTTIEAISDKTILAYITFLRSRGNAPRTVRNRTDFLQIFLRHFGLPSLLKGKKKPQYTEKRVQAFNSLELGKMFGHATVDEADLLHFLLSTGSREQEMQFACWSDLDLVAKRYTVTEHRDLQFTPKDKEEGGTPLPDVLVDRLTARRKRYPHARLIFPTKDNKPNGHALRIVKTLALRAGVNCGHCVNKAGKSCGTHPVCRHVFLHKLRKTYATMLHKNGVSARTIMGYLRHSELDTTLRYLAEGDDEQTRVTINRTFNGLGGDNVAA